MRSEAMALSMFGGPWGEAERGYRPLFRASPVSPRSARVARDPVVRVGLELPARAGVDRVRGRRAQLAGGLARRSDPGRAGGGELLGDACGVDALGQLERAEPDRGGVEIEIDAAGPIDRGG